MAGAPPEARRASAPRYPDDADAARRDPRRRLALLDRQGAHAGAPADHRHHPGDRRRRSEEHTSELQSLMRITYAVFCLKKKKYLITNIQLNFSKNCLILNSHIN